jgi:hypothetical protein
LWSRDGKYILSGSQDWTVRVWEVDEQVLCVYMCVHAVACMCVCNACVYEYIYIYIYIYMYMYMYMYTHVNTYLHKYKKALQLPS